MKIRGLFSSVLLMGAAFATGNAHADAPSPPATSDTPCLPAVYTHEPTSCLMVGPAAVLTRHALMEAEIARQDDWITPLADSYGEVPYRYAKLTSSSRPRVYSSLEAAIDGKNPSRTLVRGFTYITYTGITTVNSKRYYHIGYNQWIRSGDIERHITPTAFSGVEVSEQPDRPFGWALVWATTRISPGRSSPASGQIARHGIIQVFDTATVGEIDWYLVGPGQWVDQRSVALVYPRSEPPPGVDNGRWIELNLFEQTTAVYEQGRLVFATLTTSGSKHYYTRPGLFKIYEVHEVTPMAGAGADGISDAYYLEGVPWTMFFDQRRAFHGEYWHDHLGYTSSHGCANLAFADAEWLYNWAKMGDWVYVWDPSGETPVLPELFTQHLNGSLNNELKAEQLEDLLK